MCCFVFFLSSQLRKAPGPPFLFDRRLQFGSQLALSHFLLWFSLREPSTPPAPPLGPVGLIPMLVPTVSTAKCDALIFFPPVLFLCFCFELFPFLLRLCPEKNKFCMFPAVSSHLRIYHLHLSVFYSLCKN